MSARSDSHPRRFQRIAAAFQPSARCPPSCSCWSPCRCCRPAATTPFPTAEEQAKAAWSEVLNQYQRRADLIPNLVETVKGYAAQEKDVLEGVVEARAKATQVTVSPETLTDPEAFKAFQETQAGLTGALVAAARGRRELSRPQGQPEFPGAAGAARRHREPHRGGAARLYRGGARLQHHRSRPSRRCSGRRSGSPTTSRSRISPSPTTRWNRRRWISAPSRADEAQARCSQWQFVRYPK